VDCLTFNDFKQMFQLYITVLGRLQTLARLGRNGKESNPTSARDLAAIQIIVCTLNVKSIKYYVYELNQLLFCTEGGKDQK
jgi:hypothetical protein